MKAGYCVDYLSHTWLVEEDLIESYKETVKEDKKLHRSKYMKEKKFNLSEHYKLIRYKNALWRSMSTIKKQILVDPSTVSWQKESDITWLYGPMYIKACLPIPPCINNCTQTSLQVLKPVLKSKSNVTQAPIYSDSYTYSRNPSFSSTSSSVHFNPEIIEIEYQPEYPVSHHEALEGEEDDILWSLLLQLLASLPSLHKLQCLSLFKYLFFYQHLLFLPLFWFKKRNPNK